ncbi:MAG: hypothetical protein PHI90_03255 [Clostridia bacterium]|nr:hypothetical protein [Clostridia bacterium]MDD4047835.1 hypothetical protein [Clostridia bacterium]
MEMNIIIITIISYVIAFKILPYSVELISSEAFMKKNWLGDSVPTIAGIIFPLILSTTMLMYQFFYKDSMLIVYLFAIYGIALLGLLDDTLGNSMQKGLKQHFKLLFVKRKLSTGVIKAVCTSIISAWVVINIATTKSEMIINWFLLILSVNLINLLDLRPGRALKGTVVLLLVPIIMQVRGMVLIFSTLGIIFAYAPYDLKGQTMLGDVGSNTLGMIVGLMLIETSFITRIICFFTFVMLQIIAEKYSFSDLIEHSVLLKKIDRLGQV